MTSVGRASRVVAVVLLLIALTGASAGRGAQEFAGHWVFKLGDRNFLVLDLAPGEGKNGPLEGSLSRPEHFSASGNGAISRIQLPVVRYALVRSAIDGDVLRVAFANPADASDVDEFELRLSGVGSGSLGVAGLPIDPWPLERVPGPVAIATDWALERTYRPEDSDVPSAEMARIFDADQADRLAPGKIDWAVVGQADTARRAATKALLDGAKLHAGADFTKAAFVFQHGNGSADYLLAHTLAMVAVAKGDGEALWIASATLDRYLQSIGKPQIYGTQFSGKPGSAYTQEPYDRALVSDALRRQLGVPSLAEQDKQRKQFEAGSE